MRTAIDVRSADGRVVAFGPFSFDRVSGLLWKDGTEVALPPRVLGVLALLLDRPGELVTKQELITSVWRDAFVTETSVAEAVSVLRQTLGDDPQRPTYIQTLHRRGYRFIADVQGASLRSTALDRAVSSTSAVEGEPRLGPLVPWIVTLFALLVAASAVWRYLATSAPLPRQPVRFSIALPQGLTLTTIGSPVALSDDGSVVALAACRAGDCGIYLRPMSQAEPTLVAGTAGGASPFFSPDGRWLGYFANGRLQKIALGGGSPVTLADAPEPLGATWLRERQIVFARSDVEGLFIVPEAGGDVQVLTTPATGEGGHRWPDAVPDASAVVFTVSGQAGTRYAGIVSMRTRDWSRLLDDAAGARVPMAGYLVAQRGADLIAAALDARTHSIAGLPVTVLATGDVQRASRFTTSRTGTLVVAAPGGGVLQVVLDWAADLRRLVPAPAPALPR